MSEHVDKILKGAAANVNCESNEEVSRETLESIKKQLLGESNHTDESFIYSLYQSAVNNLEEEERKNVRR